MPKKLYRVKWRESRWCHADVFAMSEEAAIDCLYFADIRENDIEVDKEDIQEVLSCSEING